MADRTKPAGISFGYLARYLTMTDIDSAAQAKIKSRTGHPTSFLLIEIQTRNRMLHVQKQNKAPVGDRNSELTCLG